MPDIPTHLSTSDSYEKRLLVQQGFLLKCTEFLLGRGFPIIGVGAGLGLLFGIGLDALRKRLAERLSRELDSANATETGVG